MSLTSNCGCNSSKSFTLNRKYASHNSAPMQGFFRNNYILRFPFWFWETHTICNVQRMWFWGTFRAATFGSNSYWTMLTSSSESEIQHFTMAGVIYYPYLQIKLHVGMRGVREGLHWNIIVDEGKKNNFSTSKIQDSWSWVLMHPTSKYIVSLHFVMPSYVHFLYKKYKKSLNLFF